MSLMLRLGSVGSNYRLPTPVERMREFSLASNCLSPSGASVPPFQSFSPSVISDMTGISEALGLPERLNEGALGRSVYQPLDS
jgi:hypothetical protein